MRPILPQTPLDEQRAQARAHIRERIDAAMVAASDAHDCLQGAVPLAEWLVDLDRIPQEEDLLGRLEQWAAVAKGLADALDAELAK